MIEFIIFDNTKDNFKIIEKEIDKEMMSYDLDYKTRNHSILEEVKTNTNNDNFKIYILNQTNIRGTGLEIAKYIRESLDDWKSIIIFISKTDDYKINVLTKSLYILDYILIEDIKTKLQNLIKISMKIYDSRPKELKFKYKNNSYNISFKDIVYIEKEKDSKRCIIYTKKNKYSIQSNLNEILSKLDDRFIKCSRTYIINKEEMSSYNTKDNIITFKNKKEIYEISRDKKKEIISYLRKV